MSNMSALISSSKTPSTDTLSSSNISTTNISLSNDTNTKPAKSKKKKSRQLDPEARLKRTQQNRAAQRAFRERKEKKMRELENKVTKLTEIQRQNEIESSFLRDQLNLLLLELKKYRPTTENDLKILNYLSKHSNDPESSTVPTLNTVDTNTTTTTSHNTNWLNKLLLDNDLFTQQLFDNQLHNSTDNSASPLSFSNKYNDNQIVFNSNANSKDQLNSDTALDFNNQFDEQVANFCVKMNEACGTKNNPIPRNKSLVTTDTPFTNSNILSHSPLSSNSLSFVSTSSHTNNSNNNKNDLTTSLPFTNYANNSDVNPFEINTNQNLDSPQLTTSSTNTTTSNNNNNNNNNNTSVTDEISLNGQDAKNSFDLQFLSNDFEIPFINSELAFPTVNNENDLYFRDTNPLKGTTTNNILDDFIADEENNIYDKGLKIRQSLPTSLFNEVPYTVQLATTNNKDQFHGHDDDDNIEDGDPQVVPSKDGKMLKCSEIWDRITTHPKYSELDIDGLCVELMAKAKCSDKGAVVDADVVQDVLTKHIQ